VSVVPDHPLWPRLPYGYSLSCREHRGQVTVYIMEGEPLQAARERIASIRRGELPECTVAHVTVAPGGDVLAAMKRLVNTTQIDAQKYAGNMTPLREPPKVWPEQGEDYANNMPATELRRGDQFYVGGQGEVPGKAEVQVVGLQDLTDYVLALVKIPKSHVFDYVDRVPQ
jgi:hypothetical protein